jgi:hypothetical protein
MKLSSSSEAAGCTAIQDLSKFYGTQRFITIFTRTLHWTLPQARSTQSKADQSSQNHPILSMIHFNIIQPPTSWSSQWPLLFSFPTNILNGYNYYYYYFFFSSSPLPIPHHLCYLPSLSHPSF